MPYQITCVEKRTADSFMQTALASMGSDSLIVAVQTADGRRWTVDEVIQAITAGDTFFTQPIPNGIKAQVVIAETSTGAQYIRTRANHTHIDNLEKVAECRSAVGRLGYA